MRCEKCDYELKGLKDNCCPECGTPFDPEGGTSRKELGRGMVILIALLFMGLSGFILIMDTAGGGGVSSSYRALAYVVFPAVFLAATALECFLRWKSKRS